MITPTEGRDGDWLGQVFGPAQAIEARDLMARLGARYRIQDAAIVGAALRLVCTLEQHGLLPGRAGLDDELQTAISSLEILQVRTMNVLLAAERATADSQALVQVLKRHVPAAPAEGGR